MSAILATSAVAFATVKYLGVKALLTKELQTTLTNFSSDNSRRAFTKAVITGILNPKVALFFLAFLPQFVDLQRGSVFFQFFILGVVLAGLNFFQKEKSITFGVFF